MGEIVLGLAAEKMRGGWRGLPECSLIPGIDCSQLWEKKQNSGHSYQPARDFKIFKKEKERI